MLKYSVYLGPRTARCTIHPLLAADDLSALTSAQRLGSEADVWQGVRLVGRVRKGVVSVAGCGLQ